MTTEPANTSVGGRRMSWDLAGQSLAVLVLILVLASAAAAVTPLGGKLAPTTGSIAVVAWAAAIYLMGHGFRILRLALLLGGVRIGFRTIASFHLFTAAASLLAPLKLGELYRIVELSHLVRSPARAVIVVWWERIFDVMVILAMLAVAISGTLDPVDSEFMAVGIMAMAFVAVTALAVFLVPPNLVRASFFIIRRYRNPQSVHVLRLLNATRRAVDAAPHAIRGKIATLAALTACVWACELGAFWTVLSGFRNGQSGLREFLSFLSSITRGETVVCQYTNCRPKVFDQIPYLTVTQHSLLAAGLCGGLYYVIWRMRAQTSRAGR